MERCAVIAVALCNGSQFLSQLILYKRSRQTARKETVAFGAQRIAGLYDYKGRFSQESRHCLSLYVSKDVILTGVDFAAVYANTTLTSFTFFARDQSPKGGFTCMPGNWIYNLQGKRDSTASKSGYLYKSRGNANARGGSGRGTVLLSRLQP